MPDTSTRNSLALPLAADGGQTFYTGLHTNFEAIDAAIAKCNFAGGAIDPDADNDVGEGYSVGSKWHTDTAIWECTDASEGAAVWKQLWPPLTVDLSGTITNAQLAGSISNDKLAGSISNDKLAGSISNDKLAGSITDAKLASVYALLLGRAGGQTLEGDTASAGNLNLSSTHHATKGKIYLGASDYYDEVLRKLVISAVDIETSDCGAMTGTTAALSSTVSAEGGVKLQDGGVLHTLARTANIVVGSGEVLTFICPAGAAYNLADETYTFTVNSGGYLVIGG